MGVVLLSSRQFPLFLLIAAVSPHALSQKVNAKLLQFPVETGRHVGSIHIAASTTGCFIALVSPVSGREGTAVPSVGVTLSHNLERLTLHQVNWEGS